MEERYPDGLVLEKRFDTEVREFVNGATGVECDDVAAAILLRDSGRFDLLKALQQRLITVMNEEVDVDTDTVETLLFKTA